MIKVIGRWYRRYFSDPQAVLLTLILVVGFTVVLTMGNMLAPALAALVIAYLLEGIVRLIQRRSMRRLSAVLLVFILFTVFVAFLLFGVVPLLSVQVSELVKELPRYLGVAQQKLLQLPQQYSFITEKQVHEIVDVMNRELASTGQRIVTVSLANLNQIITLLVYLILVPLLVFFFLKDKESILNWFSGLLPQDRQLASQVWSEMDRQLGNYVRGKFWEILIVGGVTWVAFEIGRAHV